MTMSGREQTWHMERIKQHLRYWEREKIKTQMDCHDHLHLLPQSQMQIYKRVTHQVNRTQNKKINNGICTHLTLLQLCHQCKDCPQQNLTVQLIQNKGKKHKTYAEPVLLPDSEPETADSSSTTSVA